MTTARDIIRLVLEDIDIEIKIQESSLQYAEEKKKKLFAEKKSAMTEGTDFATACVKFDHSIGFHSAMELECEEKLEALKRMRDRYELLDKRIAKEASLEAMREVEENE